MNVAPSNAAQQLIYIKSNIGGWFFDAIIRADHTSSLTITEHPVQTGAAITDHSYINPTMLTMEVGMTDVAQGIVPGQFSGSWSRSVKAFQVLKELQQTRIPFQVLTRLGLYKNMLIETLSVPDDYKTLYGLRATVTMREIMVATVQTVKISARPQITDKTVRGNVEPVRLNESIIYQIEKMLGPEAQKFIDQLIKVTFGWR
jgi:hypothetical protein